MKVTLNWLRQYVDFDWSPEELAGRLTLLGLEVEGMEKVGGEFGGLVVAQVLAREKHPNADKLSVCRVADGAGERQIVCGAQNFQAGDKVPLILPGHALPARPGDREPFVIKVGRIRGVESHGMLCSADELGLDPEAIGHRREDGLLILRPEARVGQPFAEYLGRGGSDVVYDLEVTPNRPDLSSVLGIAREIAALTGRPLRIPSPDLPAGTAVAGRAADAVTVRLEAADLCPRYTARVVRGVKIGPSPDWLRATLEKVGLRSINNVVDITNYVMLETGQPLHAFDLGLVTAGAGGGAGIVVRRAVEGEKFVTLDGQERALNAESLLIADAARGIALAGIMGGRNTEIHAGTGDVLVESAHFAATNIRRTSKRLGLRTDASYRFERGADPNWGLEYASARCVALLVELAGGIPADGVVDAYPAPVVSRRVTLRHHKVNELLGVELEPDRIETYLGRLGLVRVEGGVAAGGGPVVFAIPTFRVDLKRETDLIEEVVRLHGVDQVPATPPRGALGHHAFDAVHDRLMELRRCLASLGLTETQGQTLVSDGLASPVVPGLVRLANPLSSDMNVLRPSLLPGLLDILAHNLSRRNEDLALFEVGRVFTAGRERPVEGWRVALALTGARQPVFWSGAERGARVDLFDLKGILEEFLERTGLRGISWVRPPESPGIFLESAVLSLGGRVALGQFGQLQPGLARQLGLRDPVFLAELDVDQWLARRNPARSFKPLPSFPAVRRDLALVVPEATTHDAVLAAVRQARLENLEKVEIFDVFRGGQVPAGHKSVAYGLTYRAADRTLKDEEVQASQARLVQTLRTALGATVRE